MHPVLKYSSWKPPISCGFREIIIFWNLSFSTYENKAMLYHMQTEPISFWRSEKDDKPFSKQTHK